jgi:hypothetical protein
MKPGYRVNPYQITPNNGGVSVLTTSTLIVAENSSRNGIVLVNGGSNPIWVSFGTAAVVGQGAYLAANGGALPMDDTALWCGAIYGIGVGGASQVGFIDF